VFQDQGPGQSGEPGRAADGESGFFFLT
jgi:hypothetical protein